MTAAWKTTADIHAVHDDTAFLYALRFSAYMAGGLVIISLVNWLVGRLDSRVYFIAAMVAWIGTQPSTPPRFRSIMRHFGTLLLAMLFGITAPLILLLLPDARFSAISVIFNLIAFSMIAALIDTTRFLLACVATPGPTLNLKGADSNCDETK